MDMKKYLCNILAVFLLLAVLPPMRVWAAGGDGFRLDGEGTVTVLSQHAAKEEISSLCFSLQVESENADRVEFQFEEGAAEIQESRYDKDTGTLKVYVAGKSALFAEGTDSLTIGRLTVWDAGGGEASARVSVVEDSLQYVYGAELKTMQELDLPGVVQIGPAGETPPEEPDEDGDEGAEEEPAQPGAAAVTPSRTPGSIKKPPVTVTPVRSPSPSPSPTPSGRPENASRTPSGEARPSGSGEEKGNVENDQLSGQSGREHTEGLTEGEAGGVNWVVVVTVIVIVIVAAALSAFVLLWRRKEAEGSGESKENGG